MIKLQATEKCFEYLASCSSREYNKRLALSRKSEEHYKKNYPNIFFEVKEWVGKTINGIVYSKGFTTYEKNDVTGVSYTYNYIFD